jgi:TorA maturation chaperone TorD
MSEIVSSEECEAIGFCGQVLGALFLTDPKEPEFQSLRAQLEQLSSFEEWPFGDGADLKVAYALMQEGLVGADGDLAREYQRLFIGPHHFNAPAWGSVYLDKDQVLFGASLLELRQWMRENGITINEDKREPEDHIGKMLVLLGWLAVEKPALIRDFLGEHLMPWAPRYLELLQKDARQPFYEGLAVLTRVSLEELVIAQAVLVRARKRYF